MNLYDYEQMDTNPIIVTAPDFNPLPLVFLLVKSSLFLHPASQKMFAYVFHYSHLLH